MDSKPQHNYCPPGKDSWSFYQSAVGKGKEPGLHDKNRGTLIREQVFDKILSSYNELSDEKLFWRCAQRRTQNANESLHSMIWCKCLKDTFLSRYLVELSVTEAITEYN